jgi:hypothetical protein
MIKNYLLQNIADPRQAPCMSCEEWLQLKRDKWLSGYILWAARSMARKNEELFEDLVQEAWLRIDTNLPGLTLEYYAQEAYRAMHGYYKREWRHWRLTRRKWSSEPAIRRLQKTTKKYFIKAVLGSPKQGNKGRRTKAIPVGLRDSVQPQNTKSPE